MSDHSDRRWVDAARADTTGNARYDTNEIYALIFEAIVDHKLLPGTHLKEDVLCDIYGIGRTRIRSILSRLASDHIVDVVPNRGAFVCRPTVDEAREVFRARRLIEGHLVRCAAENVDDEARNAFVAHLADENRARSSGDQSAVIKRCGEYHQVIADHAHSPIIARFLRELVARSSLIIAVFEQHAPDDCEMDEHVSLNELILAGDANGAAALMERHLRGIENRLHLEQPSESSDNLRTALGGRAAQRQLSVRSR